MSIVWRRAFAVPLCALVVSLLAPAAAAKQGPDHPAPRPDALVHDVQASAQAAVLSKGADGPSAMPGAAIAYWDVQVQTAGGSQDQRVPANAAYTLCAGQTFHGLSVGVLFTGTLPASLNAAFGGAGSPSVPVQPSGSGTAPGTVTFAWPNPGALTPGTYSFQLSGGGIAASTAKLRVNSGHCGAAQASVGLQYWSLQVGASGSVSQQQVSLGSVVPVCANDVLQAVYVQTSFSGVPSGTHAETVFAWNGKPVLRDAFRWDGPSSGQAYYALKSLVVNGLPAGLYDFSISLDRRVVATDAIAITSSACGNS